MAKIDFQETAIDFQPSEATAFPSRTTTPITLRESIRRTTALDVLGKVPVPFNPWQGYQKWNYLEAKKRLTEGDYTKYAQPKYGITPFGGYTIVQGKYTQAGDELVVDEFESWQKEVAERGQTTPYQIGAGIRDILPWIADIAVSGGVRKSITSSLDAAIKSPTLAKSAGLIANSLVATSLQPSRYADTLADVKIQDPELTDTDANIKAVKRLYISNLSEMTGEFITKGAVKGAGWTFRKLPFTGKLLNKLSPVWQKITGGTAAEYARKISTATGVNDMFGEVGEERVETTLMALTNSEDFGASKDAGWFERVQAGWNQDADSIGVELAVLAAPVGARFIASRIAAPAEARRKFAGRAFRRELGGIDFRPSPTEVVPSPEIAPEAPRFAPEERKAAEAEITPEAVIEAPTGLQDLSDKELAERLLSAPPTSDRWVAAFQEKKRRRIEAQPPAVSEPPPAGLTPAEAAKEPPAPIPPPPGDAKDAVNLLDQYWAVKDEAELEVLRDTMLNQRAIAESLGQKRYDPASNKTTSDVSQAMMLYIDLQEHPEGHNFVEELSDEQKRIYVLSQNLPENVRQVADSISEQNRQAGEMLKDEDVIRNARENYIAHIWDISTEEKPLFARFSQKTARRLKRTLEGGIVEGWARGMNLRIADVTEASRVARTQGIQALAGKKLLDTGKEWRIMSHTQPSGWEKVEHPNFSYWHQAGQVDIDPDAPLEIGNWVRPSDRSNLGKITDIEGNRAEVHFINKQEGTEETKFFPLSELKAARSYGKNFFITDKGVLMEKTPVYAEPVLAKKLNKIFSTSGLYKIPGVRTITKYNAQIKTTILFTSLFHHQAYIRSQMFGSRILNTQKAYRIGRQAIENLDPELRLLVRNGMTIGRIQDYDPSFIHGDQTIWGRVLSRTKLTEAGRKAIVNLRDRQERFLFGKLGPHLKAGSALVELRAEMKKNKAKLESGEVTIDEVAKAVAVLMNNDFGGLHLGRLERGATAQHLFRLLTLAPDWTESNVKSVVQMLNRGELGHVHRLFWTRVAVKGFGATIALNLLLAGFDDDDFWTRLQKAWKANRLRWLDVDITPIYRALGGKDEKRKYFSLIGHFRDPIKFIVHPFVSAKHKASVFGRVMLDMAIGQDWAGREFTTIGELLGITEDDELQGRLVKWGRGAARPIEPGQVPSYLLYETRSSMPIPIQNAISFLSGELDAFDAITKSLGLMVHTTHPPRKKRAVPKKPIFKRRGTSTKDQKAVFKKRTR